VVTIDFITKIPKTVKQHVSIMVVVDKLAKVVDFVHVNTTHKEKNIANIYMKEVVKLHGVSKVIFSDRDSKFTSRFLQGLFKGFGTNMNLSMTYHQESYG